MILIKASTFVISETDSAGARQYGALLVNQCDTTKPENDTLFRCRRRTTCPVCPMGTIALRHVSRATCVFACVCARVSVCLACVSTSFPIIYGLTTRSYVDDLTAKSITTINVNNVLCIVAVGTPTATVQRNRQQ